MMKFLPCNKTMSPSNKDDHLKIKIPTGAVYSKNRRCIIITAVIVVIIFVLSNMTSVLYMLYPEIKMSIYSQCKSKHAVDSWDGTFLRMRVWRNNNMIQRQKEHPNFRVVQNVDGIDRRRRYLGTKQPMNNLVDQRLILWGSHHKTGTFLAQKIFSVVCAKMQWCCVFHLTRDSIYSIQSSLDHDVVHILGHTQWIWYPEEFGIPYKFIHFYRNPFKKIISGYRYHRDGAEMWTARPQTFHKLCNEELLRLNEDAMVSRDVVVEHCTHLHLCESCCRREHEYDIIHSKSGHRFDDIYNRTIDSHHSSTMTKYAVRSHKVYEFMCKYLGQVNTTLMDGLMRMNAEDGILAEASLDYYENYRMARIYNHTALDQHSINIDLDYYMKNYETTTRYILNHLQLPITSKQFNDMVYDINFYDLDNSPTYRWFMSNPITNHIDTAQSTTHQVDYLSILTSNKDFMHLYQPIIDLMDL